MQHAADLRRPPRSVVAAAGLSVAALVCALLFAVLRPGGEPTAAGQVPVAPVLSDQAPVVEAVGRTPQRIVPGRVIQRHVLTSQERLQRTTQKLARQAARAAAANPLAGRTWGVYEGAGDQAWAPYDRASGSTKDALATIALTPKAKWFGDWIPNSQIASNLTDYIANAQHGDPDALVQMAFFRMVPWEDAACHRLPTGAEQASYEDWMDRAAAAIGDTHTAVILQPDGPFAMCFPDHSTLPSELIGYAAKLLSSLPHTSVYIDAGAADWPAVGQGGVDEAVRFLLPAGIQYARGIALNSTHYSATNLEIERGAAIVQALAAQGITGKHVVINTSSNGHPFEFGLYDGADPDNARVCHRATDAGYCVTLGIPPTTAVTDAKWGLTAADDALAQKYVDAYLWFGRPWLYDQADPFDMGRALGLVASSPY